jgi:hypothetical protein
MPITLTDGTTTVNLHPDLLWSDEHNWHPVAQTAQRGLSGSLIVQAAKMLKGRPITLETEDDDSGAMTLAVVEQLRNWTAVEGQQLTITLRGVSRTVIFRHHDGPALEAKPWIHRADVASGDFYICVLRFTEI